MAKFYFISLGGATFPNQGDNHNDRPFDFTTSGIFVIFVTFQLKPLIISDLKQNSSEVDLTKNSVHNCAITGATMIKSLKIC